MGQENALAAKSGVIAPIVDAEHFAIGSRARLEQESHPESENIHAVRLLPLNLGD